MNAIPQLCSILKGEISTIIVINIYVASLCARHTLSILIHLTLTIRTLGKGKLRHRETK